MTLPLIHLLSKSTILQKRHIIHIVRNHSTEPERVEEVINLVKNSGGIEYAHEMMMKYCTLANDIINEFPESAYKSSLIQLVQYTIERNK
jgi:octaprenyl-diphosphate synthase